MALFSPLIAEFAPLIGRVMLVKAENFQFCSDAAVSTQELSNVRT